MLVLGQGIFKTFKKSNLFYSIIFWYFGGANVGGAIVGGANVGGAKVGSAIVGGAKVAGANVGQPL